MAKVYRANSPSEALKLAQHFKEGKKYDLFRGQNEDWPLISSEGRLPPPKIEKIGNDCFGYSISYHNMNRQVNILRHLHTRLHQTFFRSILFDL